MSEDCLFFFPFSSYDSVFSIFPSLTCVIFLYMYIGNAFYAITHFKVFFLKFKNIVYLFIYLFFLLLHV